MFYHRNGFSEEHIFTTTKRIQPAHYRAGLLRNLVLSGHIDADKKGPAAALAFETTWVVMILISYGPHSTTPITAS